MPNRCPCCFNWVILRCVVVCGQNANVVDHLDDDDDDDAQDVSSARKSRAVAA